MLVLSRDCDSSIRIGPDITIKVLAIRKQHVKIGVDAPSSLRIWRDEIAPEDATKDRVAASAGSGTDSGREFPVLVVEDDPDQAALIAHSLAMARLPSVTVVKQGSEAVDALLPENDAPPRIVPSLVLLDLNLPDIPGMEVLCKIRQTPTLAAIPVVVLTSATNDELARTCLSAGANAFVTKAKGFDQMVESIGRIAAFWSRDHCQLSSEVS